ncbi:hypothetical protein Hanom_Chr06g00536901 [Helianthus anomalus]
MFYRELVGNHKAPPSSPPLTAFVAGDVGSRFFFLFDLSPFSVSPYLFLFRHHTTTKRWWSAGYTHRRRGCCCDVVVQCFAG